MGIKHWAAYTFRRIDANKKEDVALTGEFWCFNTYHFAFSLSIFFIRDDDSNLLGYVEQKIDKKKYAAHSKQKTDQGCTRLFIVKKKKKGKRKVTTYGTDLLHTHKPIQINYSWFHTIMPWAPKTNIFCRDRVQSNLLVPSTLT